MPGNAIKRQKTTHELDELTARDLWDLRNIEEKDAIAPALSSSYLAMLEQLAKDAPVPLREQDVNAASSSSVAEKGFGTPKSKRTAYAHTLPRAAELSNDQLKERFGDWTLDSPGKGTYPWDKENSNLPKEPPNQKELYRAKQYRGRS